MKCIFSVFILFSIPSFSNSDILGVEEKPPCPSKNELQQYSVKNWSEKTKHKLKRLKEPSRNGCPHAQILLGKMYLDPLLVVPLNKKRAFYWFKKAAEKRHAEAQYLVGLMYEKGEGVEKDISEAIRWYKEAAGEPERTKFELLLERFLDRNFRQNHNHLAQYRLGYLHYEGESLEKNDEEAFRFFGKAAKKGHLEAWFYLGKMHQEGSAPEGANHEKAFFWLEKVARRGHKEAQYLVSLMYKEGMGVEASEEKAHFWLKRAAKDTFLETGHSTAKHEFHSLEKSE